MISEETTRRRRQIVDEWNKCDETMAQIGARLGLPRTTIARNLCEARKLGWFVVAVERSEGARRRNESWRAKIGEDAYLKILAAQLVLARAARARKRAA